MVLNRLIFFSKIKLFNNKTDFYLDSPYETEETIGFSYNKENNKKELYSVDFSIALHKIPRIFDFSGDIIGNSTALDGIYKNWPYEK